MTALSSEAVRRVAILFQGADQTTAEHLLVDECGSNLPGLERLSPIELDRFRFAALKLSGGRLDGLREAIKLAQSDWRDLLTAAGFDRDVTAHTRWMATDAL